MRYVSLCLKTAETAALRARGRIVAAFRERRKASRQAHDGAVCGNLARYGWVGKERRATRYSR
jgi:hypothetical protein